MIRQAVETLRVPTRGRGFYEITRRSSHACKAAVQTGLCTLHLQHTSASLLIQENADPDVRRDFERFFARLVPDGDPSSSTPRGRRRHARARAGRRSPVKRASRWPRAAVLGTWQGMYLWEHRTSPHTRTVVVHVIGEGGGAARGELP